MVGDRAPGRRGALGAALPGTEGPGDEWCVLLESPSHFRLGPDAGGSRPAVPVRCYANNTIVKT